MTRPQALPAQLAKYRVSSHFGLRSLEGSRNHLGTDWATPVGVPLEAVGDGRVSAVGGNLIHGWGYYLHLDLGDGDTFEYHVLKERPDLRVGDRVKRGDIIAHTGSSGALRGVRYRPHFHGGARDRNGYYNPLTIGFSSPAGSSTATPFPEGEEEMDTGFYVQSSPAGPKFYVSRATGRKRSISSAEWAAIRSAESSSGEPLPLATVSAKQLAAIPGS